MSLNGFLNELAALENVLMTMVIAAKKVQQ